MAFIRTAAIAALAVTAVFVSFSASMAGPYAGYVTAYSRYGNGIVRAPVRAAQFGYQVKLPGGPWLYCERSSLLFDRNRPCSETLRRQTLDFWETISEEQSGGR
ncbi:hypothetical protein BMS3Bbin10_00779 [bacterium BMS3Bbin10]|nr:hypothetical protein BMS3Bbin10_00779 [bacterium BMS3Bbin10]